MQFTATKSLARGYFYRDFLPSHLTASQLANAEFLVLLGDDDMERLELDALDIPGRHIHSVEQDRAVFARQLQRNRNNDSPVNLYFQTLETLIVDYLHSNRRLQVLNLDICGSYLTCIDPVMTKILRFARRNTQTVIATYTNVGRDREQIREGLKSLAICHRVAPAVTARVATVLFNRYVAAGMSQEVSINMVLRHLFWVRSHLEHVLLGGVNSGVLTSEDAAEYLTLMEQWWKLAAEAAEPSLAQGFLTYNAWLQIVDNLRLPLLPTSRVMSLIIQEVKLVTYASANGFSHTGWFAVYGFSRRQTVEKWLEQSLEALIDSPLLYAPHGASCLSWLETVNGFKVGKQTVWKSVRLATPCRTLPIPQTSIGLMALDRELSRQQSVNEPVVSTAPSPNQRQLIRDLARQGKNTDEVMQALPEPKPPRSSVTAMIANARRKQARS